MCVCVSSPFFLHNKYNYKVQYEQNDNQKMSFFKNVQITEHILYTIIQQLNVAKVIILFEI